MGTGVRGLTNNNGYWLAQVIVDGTRHRRGFGIATPDNAALAVQWMDALRSTRTAVLVGATADTGVSTSIEALRVPKRDVRGYVPAVPKRPKVPGLYNKAGAWWVKVMVQGVVHTRSFGECSYSNAVAALQWLQGVRQGQQCKGTPMGVEEALQRVRAWLAATSGRPSAAERFAANRKAHAAKKRK